MKTDHTCFKPALILLCAGEGSRLGFPIPKAYIPLRGTPLYAHAMQAFNHIVLQQDCYVVVSPEHKRFHSHIAAAFPEANIVYGGNERFDSVIAGLCAAHSSVNDYSAFIIHDACRPFPPQHMISAACHALEKASCEAVSPALTIVDSVKQVNANGVVINHLPRQEIYCAQTPQILSRRTAELMIRAEDVPADITDDISFASYVGMSSCVTQGHSDAKKLTYADDYSELIQIHDAQKRLKLPQSVTVTGFDAHAFGTPGSCEYIMLGGVCIPHTREIIGHSDGDVILHALTDAILGCVSACDIGYHFTSSGSDWKDADSTRFLSYALFVMKAHGYMPRQISITVICQKPVLSPHIYSIQKRIADLVYGDANAVSSISVQATTTDYLGFSGREEGLMCYAQCSAVQV